MASWRKRPLTWPLKKEMGTAMARQRWLGEQRSSAILLMGCSHWVLQFQPMKLMVSGHFHIVLGALFSASRVIGTLPQRGHLILTAQEILVF